MSSEADVRGLAEWMLTVVRGDDVDGLATLLASVVGPAAPRRHLLEPVLAELVGIVTDQLRELSGEPESDDIFTADVVDTDEESIGIDDVDPPLRAVLRAVLAELNHDPADTRFQIGLVGADPEPLARLDAVWHALLWASILETEPA